MRKLRLLLYPFSILYAFITSIRNYFYDKGILQSTSFNLPIIAVGNLSVGGTGKTPMVEYLIRLLSDNYQIVTLSRGYKRKSKGFYLADESTKMDEIGDEPFQYHSKFKKINVAVHADRVEGVKGILKLKPNTQVIILDDAFQHRKIKASFYIMLTSYDELFYNDYVLPTGNLRESRCGVNRADVVVVTKCPKNITIDEMDTIKNKIGIDSSKIFFTYIKYSQTVSNRNHSFLIDTLKNDFIAVAGIAKPHFFYNYLNVAENDCITFPDHHSFSDNDVQNIVFKANGRKIITTEKDFMRLQGLIPENQLYYLPIETEFITDKPIFDNLIKSNLIN